MRQLKKTSKSDRKYSSVYARKKVSGDFDIHIHSISLPSVNVKAKSLKFFQACLYIALLISTSVRRLRDACKFRETLAVAIGLKSPGM